MAGFIARRVDVRTASRGWQLPPNGPGSRRGAASTGIGVPAARLRRPIASFLFKAALGTVKRSMAGRAGARAAAPRWPPGSRLNTPSAAHRIEEGPGTTRAGAVLECERVETGPIRSGTKQGARHCELERGRRISCSRAISSSRWGAAAAGCCPGAVSSLDQPQAQLALVEPLRARTPIPARGPSTVSSKRDQPRAGRELAQPPNRGKKARPDASSTRQQQGQGRLAANPARSAAGAVQDRRSQPATRCCSHRLETVEHLQRRPR